MMNILFTFVFDLKIIKKSFYVKSRSSRVVYLNKEGFSRQRNETFL